MRILCQCSIARMRLRAPRRRGCPRTRAPGARGAFRDPARAERAGCGPSGPGCRERPSAAHRPWPPSVRNRNPRRSVEASRRVSGSGRKHRQGPARKTCRRNGRGRGSSDPAGRGGPAGCVRRKAAVRPGRRPFRRGSPGDGGKHRSPGRCRGRPAPAAGARPRAGESHCRPPAPAGRPHAGFPDGPREHGWPRGCPLRRRSPPARGEGDPARRLREPFPKR